MNNLHTFGKHPKITVPAFLNSSSWEPDVNTNGVFNAICIQVVICFTLLSPKKDTTVIGSTRHKYDKLFLTDEIVMPSIFVKFQHGKFRYFIFVFNPRISRNVDSCEVYKFIVSAHLLRHLKESLIEVTASS